MTAWVLGCALVLVAGTLVMALRKIETLQDDAADSVAHEHAKCMALVAEFVGDDFGARVLEAASEDYASSQGQSDQRRLAQDWEPDGKSIPCLWMEDRARSLRAKHSA